MIVWEMNRRTAEHQAERRAQDVMEHIGPGSYWMLENGGILIIGEAQDSPYQEDMPFIQAERIRGWIFGKWYSEACKDGELGMNHFIHCIRIQKEFFDKLLKEIQNASR